MIGTKEAGYRWSKELIYNMKSTFFWDVMLVSLWTLLTFVEECTAPICRVKTSSNHQTNKK
jgi:hypothetical protein